MAPQCGAFLWALSSIDEGKSGYTKFRIGLVYGRFKLWEKERFDRFSKTTISVLNHFAGASKMVIVIELES